MSLVISRQSPTCAQHPITMSYYNIAYYNILLQHLLLQHPTTTSPTTTSYYNISYYNIAYMYYIIAYYNVLVPTTCTASCYNIAATMSQTMPTTTSYYNILLQHCNDCIAYYNTLPSSLLQYVFK